MVLTRIEPISLAKVSAVVYAFIGLLVGLPMGCFFSMVGSQVEGGGFMTGIGLSSLIVLALFWELVFLVVLILLVFL
jgi:hypothetical protein